jgi:hypothetical protein
MVETPSGKLLVVTGWYSPVSVHELTANGPVKIGEHGLSHKIQGAAVDASGQVYVTDGRCVSCLKDDGSVEVVAGSRDETGDVDGVGGEARFGSGTVGLAFAPDDSMLVSDCSNDKVKRVFKVQGGDDWRVVTVPDHRLARQRIKSPAGVAYCKMLDSFLVACKGSYAIRLVIKHAIKPFAGNHGEFGSGDGHISEAHFHSPERLACDAKGNVVVLDYGCWRGSLRYISHTGRVQTVKVIGLDGQAATPQEDRCQPYITRSGQLFLANAKANQVWLLDHGGALSGDSHEYTAVALRLSAVMGKLWQQQQEGEHCDVTFQVGPEEIRAHRSVLAASSDYFKASISSDWDHQQGGSITIGGTTAPVFRTVLRWLYTQQLEVEEGADLTDVLLLAKQYLLPDLEGACCKEIESTMIDLSSAARVFVWADENSLDDLRKKAKATLIKKRFQIKELTGAEEEILLKRPALVVELMKAMF